MQSVTAVPDIEPPKHLAKPHRRGGQRWTADEPPQKIKDFCHWWVHERQQGQGVREYAVLSGYGEVTLCNWLKDPRVLHVLDAEMMGTAAGPLRVLDVLNMLHQRAVLDSDVKAAGLYLSAVGRMAPRRQDINVTVTDARGLSNEQLAVELRRAVALIEGQPGALAEVIEDAEVISDVISDGVTQPASGSTLAGQEDSAEP